MLFVSGTSSNQGKFYPQFDHVVLLSAPVPLLLERLATRTNNPYGKHPDELAQILGYVRTVEPLLRRTCSLEVDTSAPIERVIEIILSLVVPGSRAGERSGTRDRRDSPGDWAAVRPATIIRRGRHAFRDKRQLALLCRRPDVQGCHLPA